MTGEEWQAIDAARQLLNLGERATVGEIKRSYRQMCKRHHPDIAGDASVEDAALIRQLTRSYDLLMRYCTEYRIPFYPEDVAGLAAEDWWMDRFGRDPLWGKKEGKENRKR